MRTCSTCGHLASDHCAFNTPGGQWHGGHFYPEIMPCFWSKGEEFCGCEDFVLCRPRLVEMRES